MSVYSPSRRYWVIIRDENRLARKYESDETLRKIEIIENVLNKANYNHG